MQAHRLYQSVSRLLRLPPDTVLCPGHASTPTAFDGVFLSERLGNVAQRLQPWMVSETSFTERVLARIPPTPANYEQIVEWNEAGILPPVDPTDLEAGANRCAVG